MKRGSDRFLIALLALAGSACNDPEPRSGDEEYVYDYGSGCEPTGETTYEVELPTDDPPLELRIESCRRDVDACAQLCYFLVTGDENWLWIEECSVRFFPDMVRISITFAQGCT